MNKVIFIFFLFLMPLVVSAQGITRIIAKVNNQVITSKDLDDYCKVLQLRLTDSRDDFLDESNEFRKQALDRLIEDKLILDQANREKITIPRTVIDERLKQIIDSHSSYEEFDQSLQERGFTVTRLKEKINEQYLMRELIQMRVKSFINISPQELSTYYAENKDKMLSPIVYVFYIATSPDSSKLKVIADKIKNQGIEAAIQEYASELAKLESTKDELKTEIADVLESLKPAEVKIVSIDQLHYLIYVDQAVEPRLLKLGEAQEQIQQYLWDKKFKLRFTEWIEDLKQEAVIKTYNE